MKMLQKILNIGENSVRRKNFPVMLGKLVTRITEHSQEAQKDEVLKWCAENAESYEEFAKGLDKALWDETADVCKKIKVAADKKLESLGMDMGGGGNYPLLYFFTRYIKAKTVVETGVAAGWSSQSILTALKDNAEGGKLYSSDFPYFRYHNPEELVGYVVDEELKENWTLLIDGDQNNIPEIAKQCGAVDLFHYDSDKSYKGRDFAYETLGAHLHENSIIIFDDIQDNAHFRDFVARRGGSFKVFEFEGKYIGLIAPFL